MNLFELFVKIGVDDQASGKLKDLGGKLGDGLKTAAKIGTAAVGAAATAITTLTTAAVNNYAEFEQLVGGAELMFGDAFHSVMNNAQEAYKTVQMSQNEYLQQVNGFATGLKTALGGNEQAAADLAHKIIQAEADVVAATGNSQEAVQNAFNGIMKSNFTMLDNLQIGITPTKEGFQEVIDKVNEWNKANGNATKYQMGNLADMQSALVDYIDMVGMSGYAQAEAAGTISGSVASMKAAWSDFLTSLADENADYQWQLDNLLESVKVVAGNVFPIVEQVFWSIADMIDDVLPDIVDKIPQIIDEGLPRIVDMAVKLVKTFVGGISENQDQLLTSAFNVINTLIDGITDMLPDIIVTGALLLGKLAVGVIQAIPDLVAKIPQIIKAVVNEFKSNYSQFSGIGRDIVNGVWNGISAMIGWFTNKVKGFFSGIVNGVKRTLGIHSPSKVFAGIGGFMAEGLAEGWDKEYNGIKRSIEKDLNFGTATVDFASSGIAKNYSVLHNSASKNLTNANESITIVVQSVLDGRVIGESAYQYNLNRQRAYGGAY